MEITAKNAEYVYKCSESVDFDYDKTSELCKSLGLTSQNYNRMIDWYLKNTLGLKDREFLIKKDKIYDK